MLAPSWQSIIPEIVGPERLMNAAALNMGGMNVVRLVMPAACGFALGMAETEYVYFAISAMFVASVLALARTHRLAGRTIADRMAAPAVDLPRLVVASSMLAPQVPPAGAKRKRAA